MQDDNQSGHADTATVDEIALAIEEINKARAQKAFPEGEALALDLGKRHPNDGAVQLKVFNLLHRMGRWESMLDLFEQGVAGRAIKASPSNLVLVAEAHLRLEGYDAGQAILAKLDKRSVTGVAAKRLPVIEALAARLAKKRPPAELKPQQVMTAKQRAIAHRSAPLSLSAEEIEELLSDAGAALEQARLLRLERRIKAAAQLLELIVTRHGQDHDTVDASLNALHRNGSFQEILSLLAKPEHRGLDNKPEIAILKADCLVRRGDLASRAEAKDIVADIGSGELKGLAQKVWQRLRTDLMKRSESPEVRAIEDAFGEGNALKGATLFRVLLDECRQVIASTPLAEKPVEAAGDAAGEETDGAGFADTAREVERARYSADFEAITQSSEKPNRVLIVSDSIALPRQSTGVGLKESYPYRLHQIVSSLSDGSRGVRPDCRRGRTVIDALEVIEAETARSEVVIVQLGIVDCAPRVFGASDVRAVRAAKGEEVAQSMVEIAKAHRAALVGDRFNSVYVKSDEFSDKLSTLVKKAKSIADLVIIAGIVTPSKRGGKLTAVPLASNINDYNEIMREVSLKFGAVFADCDGYIWSREDPLACFTQDNYHYNAEGHRNCADFLAEIISEHIPVKSTYSGEGR